MSFKLPALPYVRNALEPYISEETINYHYGKHHQGYVNNLNKFVEADPSLAKKTLEKIIVSTTGGVFNNAAQVWNHTFYWQCMKPDGGGEPTGKLATAISETFGSFTAFKEKFSTSAATNFGSGWTWLVKNSVGILEIVNTSNAGNPLTEKLTPVLTCDVWEHAYYIDYRNARPEYIKIFWDLVNWDFALTNFTS